MRCERCNTEFRRGDYAFWNESGSSSVKLTKCPKCNAIFACSQMFEEENINHLCKQFKHNERFKYERIDFWDKTNCEHDFSIDEIRWLL